MSVEASWFGSHIHTSSQATHTRSLAHLCPMLLLHNTHSHTHTHTHTVKRTSGNATRLTERTLVCLPHKDGRVASFRRCVSRCFVTSGHLDRKQCSRTSFKQALRLSVASRANTTTPRFPQTLLPSEKSCARKCLGIVGYFFRSFNKLTPTQR